MSLNNPHSIENFMSSGWRGNFSLLTAFFGYYVVGRLIALGVAWLLFNYLGFFGWFFAVVIWTIYWFWSLVTLWRCAFNTEFAVLFYAARALVLIDAVYAIANPPLFLFNMS